MKRLLLVAMLATGPAHAQIPVTDIANVVQRTVEHINTLIEMAAQLKQLEDQFDQLVTTHDALTGIRNLGDLFDNPLLQQYLPADFVDTYESLKTSGYAGLARTGIQIYDDYKVFDACAIHQIEGIRLNCQAQAVQGAQAAGDVRDAIEMITLRAGQLRSLQSQINTTTDPKSIAELQARIAIEQTSVANEAGRLELMARSIEAEEKLLRQRDIELQAQLFSKTKGVTIAPLTFVID